jgi:hypothetical protein
MAQDQPDRSIGVMKKQLIPLAVARLGFAAANAGGAVTRENLLLRDGKDLLAVCGVDAADAFYMPPGHDA